jgi:hypothetical protein
VERLDHLGEVLQQPGRALPVEGGAAGALQLDVEERGETGMSQPLPATAPIEVGQRDEEVGHGRPFPAEQRRDGVAKPPVFQFE